MFLSVIFYLLSWNSLYDCYKSYTNIPFVRITGCYYFQWLAKVQRSSANCFITHDFPDNPDCFGCVCFIKKKYSINMVCLFSFEIFSCCKFSFFDFSNNIFLCSSSMDLQCKKACILCEWSKHAKVLKIYFYNGFFSNVSIYLHHKHVLYIFYIRTLKLTHELNKSCFSTPCFTHYNNRYVASKI